MHVHGRHPECGRSAAARDIALHSTAISVLALPNEQMLYQGAGCGQFLSPPPSVGNEMRSGVQSSPEQERKAVSPYRIRVHTPMPFADASATAVRLERASR